MNKEQKKDMEDKMPGDGKKHRPFSWRRRERGMRPSDSVDKAQ
jgi:hypothetical protein